ncbi:DNA-directed RNA polymerase subunit delta [Mycoplasma wenyonii]|uniref:DNA-directed RNA polymerase subunit delta n=1 Tax=Mycoplasma wenyonii TaxID=65123 RepID=UPI0015EC3F60|nr:DNA-directed RNA polymerase subunit delta [Mycoplasma wenyonii]
MAKHSIRDLMDIAYEAAKEHFGRLSFNFAALWAKTWTRAKAFKKDSIENWIGAFYTELLIDPRFVYVGTHKWRLREFMDYGEYLREVGKRAQDVQFSDPDASEGEGKDAKTEVKKRGRGKKSVTAEPSTAETLTTETEVETQESSSEEQPESEEVNLDEEMESSTPARTQESEEDEDSYD